MSSPSPAANAPPEDRCTAVPKITTASTAQAPRRRRARRVFALGSMRFHFSRDQLIDFISDGVSTCMEMLVYLIGPLLILLALWIISLLSYAFFTVFLPMLSEKHAASPFRHVILGIHGIWVIYLLVNILFNYYCCVMTKHAGPHYDRVVRELAAETDMMYPETPAQVAEYRHDFEDKMFLRVRRRRAREAHQHTNISNTNNTNNEGMTHRKQAPPLNNKNGDKTNNTSNSPRPPAPIVRSWMLLGPLEWGFCNESNQPKPPRSHYDHVTKQLILNLDHFCPWVFNSIGYFNYRYFVSFLIYIFVGMLYGTAIALKPFLLCSSIDYRKQLHLERQMGHRPAMRLQPMLPFRDEKMLVTLSFMLCSAVGCAVMMLGGFHVYLTLTGQTTIEFHANWAHRRRARKIGAKWTNPYSLGNAWANFQQVFGKRRSFIQYLLPSMREPDFLPVPIPGYMGRACKSGRKDESSTDSIV